MDPKTALLVGASGLVGRHCLRLLLESPRYAKVTIFVRKPLPQQHEKLEQHVIDFETLNDYAPLITANDIYCCLGTTIKKAGSQEAFRQVDFGYPLALATLAAANHAERFLIITAIGSDRGSPFFYSRVKGQVEKEISKLAFKGVHIFRPSFILGQREESRPAEKFLIGLGKATAFAMVGPFKRGRPIEAEVIAASMIAVAGQEPEGVTIYESNQMQAICDQNIKSDMDMEKSG